MDPGTILTIVTETISLTKSAIRYIKDVTDANEDRARLRTEAQLLLLPLADLEELVIDAKTNPNWPLITCLVNITPALQQFRNEMGQLVQKIVPAASRSRNLIHRLRWPFEKSEVDLILSRIEKLKTLLLLVMEGNVSRVLNFMAENISTMRQDVTMLKDVEVSRQLAEAILWLSPLDVLSRQQALRDKREEGTRQWFLTSAEFQTWLQTPGMSLLCIGAPACGKTFLSSFVVDYLLSHNATSPVLYIYCSYKEHQRQTTVNILSSLLQQLSRLSKVLQSRIIQLHSFHLEASTKPSADELQDLLQTSLAEFQRSYILIDALDELIIEDERRDDIISRLMKLADHSNIFATSRPIPTIISSMHMTSTLHISAHEDDIRMYVSNRIEKDQSLARKIGDDLSLKELIMKYVVQKSQGINPVNASDATFLDFGLFIICRSCLRIHRVRLNTVDVFVVAPLYMNTLSDTVSKWQIREKLETFPVTLDQMYANTMTRIESQNSAAAELACRVLIWISCAIRPLTVRELQTAVAIEPGLMEMNSERLSDEHTLTSVCGGLLSVEPRTNFVRLIHYTVQGYLEKLCQTKWPTARLKIAELLLVYLSFKGLEHPPQRDVMANADEFNEWCTEMHLRYPLLDYATTNFGRHINSVGGLEHALIQPILKYAENWERNYNMLLFNKLIFYHHSREDATFKASAMHLFATWGLNTLFRPFLLRGALELDSTGPIGLTPLALAVAQGHNESVALLIDLGASMSEGPYPIHWVVSNQSERITYVLHLLHIAAMKNHLSLIDLLVEKGIDLNMWTDNSTYGRGTGTALHAAIRSGNIGALNVLLRHGARLNGFPYSPLQTAAIGRNDEVVKFLLYHGADVNARNHSGSTAIFSSVGLGRFNTTRLLLEGGADTNIVNNEGETALFKLITLCMLPEEARSKPAPMLKLLISYSADINFQDSQGWTILHHAVRLIKDDVKVSEDMLGFIGYCLTIGATLSLKDRQGMTVLHHAAKLADVAILKKFLQYDVSIEAKDDSGFTGLHHAVQICNISCVKALLQKGADVNACDNVGRTPLHYAIAKGISDCGVSVVDLVARGACTRAMDYNGQTPLHVAANQGWKRIDILLASGVDINLQDKYGWTALIYSVHRGHDQLSKLLLSMGADPNIRTNRGHTAVHFAANQGSVAILESLVRHGAKTQARDSEGNTVLLYGVRQTEMTQYLLEQGLSPTADISQYTSLHRAVHFGNTEVIQLLLKHGASSSMSTTSWEYGLTCVANSKIFDDTGHIPPTYEQAVEIIGAYGEVMQAVCSVSCSEILPLREK